MNPFSPSGFWCELVARSPEVADEWYLAGTWTDTPDTALQWLREQAARLAGALDPPVAEVFAAWLEDTGYQAVQREALAGGLPISTNAGASDRIASDRDLFVFYSLTCRPVSLHHPHPSFERKKQSCTAS